jgi:SAM-dependent methyltransferase
MSRIAPQSRLSSPLSELRLGGTVRSLFVRIFGRLYPLRRSTPLAHPFDRRHRVDTSGLHYADSLPSGHEHDRHSSGYYATAPSLFRGAISLWERTLIATGLSLSDYTVLDIGCGKGRVLMLASEYPFRKVMGVELNPKLARIAQKNLTKWMRLPRACRLLSIQNSDALTAPFPAGPVLLYLFNSFELEMVKSLLDRLRTIAATRSDPIDLLYVHPDYADLVCQTPHTELLAESEIAFSPEDAAADVFGVNFDSCSIYRIRATGFEGCLAADAGR